MKIARFERKKVVHEKRGAAGWLIGITDLTTLLLAFFIMLFSTATPREKAWVEASESMRTEFSGEQNITEVTGKAGEAQADHTWETIEKDPGLDLEYLYSIVKKQMTKDNLLQSATLWKDGDAVVISFPNELVFKPGSDDVMEKGAAVLLTMTPLLMKLPNAVQIIGYADPSLVNNDGRFGSNWHLSLARAYAVAQTLEEAGYMQSIKIQGKGALNADLLPKNLPDNVRNERLRRVDLRLTVQEP